jgi:hypothetical protein
VDRTRQMRSLLRAGAGVGGGRGAEGLGEDALLARATRDSLAARPRVPRVTRFGSS